MKRPKLDEAATHKGMESEDVRRFLKDLLLLSVSPNTASNHERTRRRVFPDDSPLALVFDLDAYESTLEALNTAFKGERWLHTFAIKANPLVPMLKIAVERGMGLECASWTEVEIALATGCEPHKVVYDSPCKTRLEIEKALKAGVHINVDNFEEAERVVSAAATSASKAVVGVRVNPLLGDGNIKELSVSNIYSKFGIALTPENRQRLLALFWNHPTLFRCLHAHVGSQGCSLDMLARGVEILVELREEIERGNNEKNGRGPVVERIDIGGGLSTNFDSDEVSPSFEEYYREIVAKVPSIEKLQRESGVTFMTEFGRSVVAKAGCVASNVEYVKVSADGTRDIAVIHGGSDLFVRTCYVPAKFPLRVEYFSTRDGTLTALSPRAPISATNGLEPGREIDVVGPLCFGGDKIFHGTYPTSSSSSSSSKITDEDVVVVRDAGANCLSLWSRHCSRPSPRVLGYRRRGEKLEWIVLRRAETCEEVIQFWKLA